MLRLAILVSIAAKLVLPTCATLADGPVQSPRAVGQLPLRLPTIQVAAPLAPPPETPAPETPAPETPAPAASLQSADKAPSSDRLLPPGDRYLPPVERLPSPFEDNLSPAAEPFLPPTSPDAFEPISPQSEEHSLLTPNLQTPEPPFDHGLSTAPTWDAAPTEDYLPQDFAAGEDQFEEIVVEDQVIRRRTVLADHWTPWHYFRHLRRQPGFMRRLANVAWQTSGRARSATGDLGIGHERVMFAPSVVETAISTANVGVQWQHDRGLHTPDRAAFYWGSPPLGPGFDRRVNTFDSRLRMELGNERLMAITDLTMRSLDPTSLDNTTGIGDMQIGAKALLVDGKRLKLSTIFRTYLPTGVERKGLGTGHTSLEPGLLFRYCLSPRTFAFGEFKYWIPLGADPQYAGDVMTTGFAISTILRESDVYAFMPTFEVRTLSFLFGGQTLADGTVARIDGETAVEIYPGARLVLGPAGDTGLWELNVAGGVTVGDDQWFDSRVIFGLRWNY